MKFELIEKCLACNSSNLLDILDLGSQPLANAYRNANDVSKEETFPLLFRVCEQCLHGQISVAINPKILYEDYSYVSGTTSTLDTYFKEFAKEIAERGRTSSVLDIAANDGSFVKSLIDEGLTACGVDPARNLM